MCAGVLLDRRVTVLAVGPGRISVLQGIQYFTKLQPAEQFALFLVFAKSSIVCADDAFQLAHGWTRCVASLSSLRFLCCRL